MADVLVRNEGSVVMLTPKSVEAKAWVDENLGLESWQWLGDSSPSSGGMLRMLWTA
jgi:hypothetical protein